MSSLTTSGDDCGASSVATESFGYNGLGSMTSRSGWTYAFDFQQQHV